jgi:Ser/Thr protein kinase RdoA (MazF antagonist)
MMKLSTMRTVDRAVDTHGQSPIAVQILKQWGHDRGTVKFFRASANFIYHFRKGGKPFFAFVRGYRTQHGLHAELVSQLPLFLRMARLLIYAQLVRSMDLPPHAEDPAWLQSLRLKLETWLDDYRASLENR